ncbi:DUF4435 domain-containing protein [Pseudoalteromonas sp. MM17-2]|uniref:DUF4435 domain-containing protein n=1 Tax=Pseudoalteromonas sp. MM17-2 TaxID=2917753 RepID=UPI001EF50388|nr:DUF4435 domain-containing protein [Pseudoalteromonas sp. MM17-2]MCG7546257.1 DUF4435 domain-containing protein [Pseudoalteromonas sp. MM17-2]
MDRVAELRIASQSYSVKFLEFIKIKAKDNNVLACIFEGEDSKYYCGRLNNLLTGHDWAGIDAGGKHEVLKLYQTIQNHPSYKTSSYVCFIDKDFEDWFSNPDEERIYVTPCYSIENFYISDDVLKRVLTSEFGISEFGDYKVDFHNVMNLYEQHSHKFSHEISPLMHWIKAHRLMMRDNKSPKKINVRNLKTDKVVAISLNEVQRSFDSSDISSVFPELTNADICTEALKEARETLNLENWKSDYRGKQALDFFRAFLNRLKQDLTSKEPQFFSNKGNVRLALSKENLISELSQYADTPECLREFIEKLNTQLAA